MAAGNFGKLVEAMKADLRKHGNIRTDAYKNSHAASGQWSDRDLKAAFEEASTTVAAETQRKEATKARKTEQAHADFNKVIKAQLGKGQRTSVVPMKEENQKMGNMLREMLAERKNTFTV